MFSGTGGKTLKRASATGVAILTSGVLSAVTAPSGTIVGTSDSQSLTNKTLDNTNTVTLKDTLFTLQDDGDTSKQARFQLSGLTTATTRTYTLPDVNGTVTCLGNSSTGSGSVVLASSPTLTTPVLGVATATSINGLTISTTTGTLSITNGKTLAVSNSLTLAGTDGTTITFQGTDTYVGRTTTDTLTNKTLTTPTITKPVMNATNPTAQTYSPSGGGTATLDLSLANGHIITMPAGNITIALSNDTNNQIFWVSILQDGTGSRTVTWFSTIRWAGGSAPTLTTTASKRDVFAFIRTGSGTYDGFVIGQNI